MSGKTVVCTRDNWLVEAADLEPGDYIAVYNRGDLDWRHAQLALNAQYGEGTFEAWTHGSVMRLRRRSALKEASDNA